MEQQSGVMHNFNNITIILVNPQMGENIGAVARAMYNFGMTNLRIVNPRDGWPNDKALAMSAGASFIIENTKIFKNFDEAIFDMQFVYATTSRIRGMNKPTLLAKEAAVEINQQKQNNKIAIIMGPENSGLRNEEIVKANKIITIPVNDDYKSINISQSLGIVCYEIFANDNVEIKSQTLEIANSAEVLGFFSHLEGELEKRNFYKVLDKREGMVNNLRNIFKRIKNFTTQDVRTLRGVVKSLANHNNFKD